ncbi:MAG: oligoendopeptidase F [Anaerolinea sp.]|nr:oligoendopeptidase F [Anaerolinea sp.]
MSDILTRDQIAPKYKWNTDSIFATPEVWSAELQAILSELPATVERFKGHLNEGPKVLADWLQAADHLGERGYKVFVYASLNQAVDTTDQVAMSRYGQAMGMYGQFLALTSFAEPEMLAIGESQINAWMDSDSRLAVYRQYFHNLFRRQQHVRSAEVEETLGTFAETIGQIGQTASFLTDSDMQFQPAVGSTNAERTLIQGTINTLLNDEDRKVRQSAWEHYCDTYLSLKNTLASNLIANVKQAVAVSRIRRYNTALEGSLFESNIPTAVFHNLIDTFKRHIPTWHRYWRIRRKALGLEKLHHWDIWAPLTLKEPQLSYEQAVDLISEGMKPLGEKYVNALRKGCLEDRWVDVFPNKGKTQGAFSAGTKGTFPFILMSFDQRIENMSTLAHELGHSMHSYLTWENQPFIYSGYSLFVAEVASNFNQAMVRAHLFKTQTDRDFQLALIQEAMNNFHRYFFIMPTLARFELEMHTRIEQGNPPNADEMIQLMTDLFSEGYGGEMEIDREREGITWAQFPHLYANFYVYSYATGISGAHALAGRILDGVPGAAEAYLQFLSSGSSLYPVDVLKRAGVDMTTPEPIERTFAVLASIVDRLEGLVE